MDTKQLHDLIADSRLSFQDDDGYYDAKEIWLDAYMKSPVLLDDLWIDALVEARQKSVTELLINVAATHAKVEASKDKSFDHSVGVRLSAAAGMTLNCGFLGADVYKIIFAYVEKYVDSEAEQWWSDCQGYDADMNQSQSDDTAYSLYRERKMSGEFA